MVGAEEGAAIGNYHTHSRYDDGKGEIEDYVLAALSRGFRYLGFSGHAPMPVDSSWLMLEENLPRYLGDVRRARERYADRITLLLGLEVDYLPGFLTPRSPAVAELGLDYVIGSVHYVSTPSAASTWTMDGSPESIEQGVARDFGGDMEAAVIEYFRRYRDMARECRPDILGHLDIVKKHNRGERWFSESASWYRRAVSEALDAVAESRSVLEVNTGALHRGITDELYPSPWILSECRARGIRVVVNADAHQPEHVDGHFSYAFELLRGVGYRSRMLLTSDGWREQLL